MLPGFCSYCGQKVRENVRSLGKLLGEFFGNIFFLDNRFIVSARTLLTSPGSMTVDFLNGKRKKYISPVTLFLFMNLVFFLFNPISDYSLVLKDQMYSQYYSPLSEKMVTKKVAGIATDKKIDYEQALDNYAEIYNRTSDNISKSIMIVNVPLIALFCYLMTFSIRKFYFDSLILCLNYFSVFLFCIVVGSELLNPLMTSIFQSGDLYNMLIFMVIVPVLYLVIAIRRFTGFQWARAGFSGFVVFLGSILTQELYRFIVFFVTYIFT